MSRQKRGREQQQLIEKELLAAGVQEWTVRPTKNNHVMVEFVREGRPCIFTYSASTDPKARLRNRTNLRRILYVERQPHTIS